MEGFIGEIRLFAGNFPPRNWFFCEGQLLSIAQYTAMFSILGTTYGGDGRTTFALPNLKGRVAVGEGNGPGLSYLKLGQPGGAPSITLNATQLPAHTHNLRGLDAEGTTASPAGAYLAEGSDDVFSNQSNVAMAPTTNTGGNQPHENRQPYLASSYIICFQGTYPQRS